MKKDKKDIAFTNRVKLILAGIGVVFFALIVFLALYHPAPIVQNNTTATPNIEVDAIHTLNAQIDAAEAADKARAEAAAANTTPGTEYYGGVY
jgi:type II secretory pathway component PulM